MLQIFFATIKDPGISRKFKSTNAQISEERRSTFSYQAQSTIYLQQLRRHQQLPQGTLPQLPRWQPRHATLTSTTTATSTAFISLLNFIDLTWNNIMFKDQKIEETESFKYITLDLSAFTILFRNSTVYYGTRGSCFGNLTTNFELFGSSFLSFPINPISNIQYWNSQGSLRRIHVV